MKRIIPLLLAALILSACGMPAAEITTTPESTAIIEEPAPEPTDTVSRETQYIEGAGIIARPQEGAYELRLDGIGLTIPVPREAAAKTVITERYDYKDIESYLSFYFIREGGYYANMFNVEAVPRSKFFSTHEGGFESPTIFAVSEDNIYLMIIGDIEILLTDPEIELYFDVRYSMKDALYNARLDAPSVLPELDAAALPAKAGELAAKGDAAITRAGAAQLVFDLLTAENKNEAYPLRYTDVDANNEHAHAIAYLDSYGLLTRFSRDGEDLDGELFRPE